MSFIEITNSPCFIAMVGAGIVYILLFCVVTLRKSYRHALEIGITKEKSALLSYLLRFIPLYHLFLL